MIKQRSQLIEAQVDLIVTRLAESGLLPSDDESETLAYNIVRQVLES